MGIDRTLLEDGKEYWVSSLRINSSFRIEKVGKVKKMKFTKINPNSPLSSYVYGYVQDVNGSNNHVEVTRWSSYKFFNTEEEAIEEYSKRISGCFGFGRRKPKSQTGRDPCAAR